MLESTINTVFTKFKLYYYRKIFGRFETREASLTAVETFCVEVIHALGTPSVNEFAQFVGISQPNATHKVQSLVKKGYVTKSQSQDDRREYTLAVTDRFYQYYNISNVYVTEVVGRIRERFEPQEMAQLERMLTIISEELMTEVPIRGIE